MENEALQQLREQYGSNPNIKANSVAGLMEYAMHLETAMLANQRELRDCRAFYEESRPIIDAVHVYVQKHKLGIGGQDVVEILLADAEALRAEVETLRNTKDPLFVIGFGDAAPAPEPAPEIKVGDSVEVTKSLSEDDAEFVGKVGTVTFITQNDLFKYVVKFRRTKYRMDGSQLRRLD